MELSEDAPSFRWGEDVTPVLGVIRDFQLRDITQENSPVMFRFRNMESGWWPWSYVVEVQGDPVEAYESVRKVFEEVSGVPFEGQFIDQGIRTHFESQIRLAKIVVIFACIAILISLLGLLAMSTYFILQRSQEVAIRKVFGSGQPRNPGAPRRYVPDICRDCVRDRDAAELVFHEAMAGGL